MKYILTLFAALALYGCVSSTVPHEQAVVKNPVVRVFPNAGAISYSTELNLGGVAIPISGLLR